MEELGFKRSFMLGDEWIYFKFYSGAQTADRILEEAIKPAVNHLLVKVKVDHWFFIRYADPDLHLRVRIHYDKPSNVGIIVRTIYKYINKFFEQELIWNVQTDTYQREVERYGQHTMELSERIFFLDSSLFINVLPKFRNPNGETQRWHFALKSIDYLLDCFEYKIEEKLKLLERIKDSFGREFGINRNLKDQLNTKFAKEWKSIEKSLNSATEKKSIISPLLHYLNKHKRAVIPLAKEILRICREQPDSVNVNELITSYIHMMMNRIFRSKQRVHELVLYDFLYRYYKSSIARSKVYVTAIVEKV
jgi:thiopeptide-type bacteriocin biosynthesis protein